MALDKKLVINNNVRAANLLLLVFVYLKYFSSSHSLLNMNPLLIVVQILAYSYSLYLKYYSNINS